MSLTEKLQYRREHGIYEVGDFVVHETYALHKVVHVTMDNNFELSNYACVSGGEIRHATDAEIKAGHRL